MEQDRHLGLDELMIVNPAGSAASVSFLGEDGTLYGLAASPPDSPAGPEAEWFLADDGTVYRIRARRRSVGAGATGIEEPEPRFFLGDDGTVFELVR